MSIKLMIASGLEDLARTGAALEARKLAAEDAAKIANDDFQRAVGARDALQQLLSAVPDAEEAQDPWVKVAECEPTLGVPVWLYLSETHRIWPGPEILRRNRRGDLCLFDDRVITVNDYWAPCLIPELPDRLRDEPPYGSVEHTLGEDTQQEE